MNDPLVELKQPPHSNEAEQALIGAMLISNSSYEDVSWLGASAFYQDRHRRIWQCIVRTLEMGKPADVVTICEALGSDLEKAGGAAYIAGLAQGTPSALNIRRYADLVRDKGVQRQLAQAATEIAEAAMTPGTREIGQLLDEAETKIFALSENNVRGGDGPKGISTLLSKVYERIDELHARDERTVVTGVPTGFLALDEKTTGMQPQDLIVIAGRPSMGKTALALNIAEHVALDPRVALPVVVFSMEMSGTQLSQRMLGGMARVDAQRLRTANLNDEEWSSLTEAMGRLHAAPIHIDDGAALTALEVRARARRIKRQHGKLGLVVVDYLQLMASKSQGENRATEISEISRSLKALAKELECPVIALSQLSRKVEDRHGRRPMMSDLRESGAIEQDADTILFLYREEVYDQDCAEEWKGVAELIIGKQRNGPIGKVMLTFLGRYTRFENYARPDGLDFAPKPQRKGKVRNFNDYKSRAAGDDSA